MSIETFRAALNTVVDNRADARADELVKNLRYERVNELADRIRHEVDTQLQQAQAAQPDVHIDPTPVHVDPTPVTIEAPITVEGAHIHIDMKPVARALAVLIRATKDVEDRAEKSNAAILKVLKQIAEQQEKQAEVNADIAKLLRENRGSKLVGKIDESGKITVERVAAR